MKISWCLIGFFFTTVCSLLVPADELMQSPLSYPIVQQFDFVMNNRPLAKIDGKVISLYDVVKKMDLFLFEYYPDAKPSPVEKYQFYRSRWEAMLEDMIHDELILLDAKQKEIQVSDTQVREELEYKFGPNVMSNLHRINYEYEEAQDMIRQQLTIQQLMGMKVHSKAFQTITPQTIKNAYENYLTQTPPEKEWTYQVLSIRGKDQRDCKEASEQAYQLLEKKHIPLERLPSLIATKGVEIVVSDDYVGGYNKLSKIHVNVIQGLAVNTYSVPVAQESRYDHGTVIRIFYLKDIITKYPQTFDQMHDKLKNELLYQTSDKEKELYIQSLKKRFGYQNHNPRFELPEDYQPFVIS